MNFVSLQTSIPKALLYNIRKKTNEPTLKEVSKGLRTKMVA